MCVGSPNWICLFSGGKDSSWALYSALNRPLDVVRLVTVRPSDGSYLYHVPAIELTSLAAESIGIPLTTVEIGPNDVPSTTDAGVRGDVELEPLERALGELNDDLENEIEGVIVGAVESEFQKSRVQAMCDRLGVDMFAPLWKRDPGRLARSMIAEGFEIRIVQVAAEGLDETWLGRQLTEGIVTELERLNTSHGVHVLGEGGEYETVVTNGPHMDRSIRFEAKAEWDGMRGTLSITDSWLEG